MYESIEYAALEGLKGKIDGSLQNDSKEEFIKRFEKVRVHTFIALYSKRITFEILTYI